LLLLSQQIPVITEHEDLLIAVDLIELLECSLVNPPH